MLKDCDDTCFGCQSLAARLDMAERRLAEIDTDHPVRYAGSGSEAVGLRELRAAYHIVSSAQQHASPADKVFLASHQKLLGNLIAEIESRPAPAVPEWKVTQTELPPEGVSVIGFNAAWVEDDFNPAGIRDCFRFGDGNDWNSCWWNDPCDRYETQSGRTGGHGAPTHWMLRPDSKAMLTQATKESDK